MKRVIESVHVVPMGTTNALLIEGDDGLTPSDAGCPSRETAVFEAIRGLGHSPEIVKQSRTEVGFFPWRKAHGRARR